MTLDAFWVYKMSIYSADKIIKTHVDYTGSICYRVIKTPEISMHTEIYYVCVISCTEFKNTDMSICCV